MTALVKTVVSPNVKAVHIATIGYGEQHLEHRYGSSKPRLWWALTSKSWITIPINVYVIEHRDGLVLFDTGMDPAIITDPGYISSPIGRYLLPRIFRLHIDKEESLARQLANLGLSASDVCKVAVSHLHFDHVGGIADVPQAELLVSQAEWQQLDTPHPERQWILREHIKLPGAKWCPIEFKGSDDSLLAPFGGYYDVMGDMSMVLLPTPGHTPGSMSLLIRSAGMPPLLLVGDLTYELDLLLRDQTPGLGDKQQLRASFAKVRALQDAMPDLVILPSHDPAAAQALMSAMPEAAVTTS